MTPEGLALIVGAALSLFFSYFPGVEGKYNELSGTMKRLVMAGALLVGALAIYGLNCTPLGEMLGVPFVPCTQAGALELLKVFLLALVANQSVFSITP